MQCQMSMSHEALCSCCTCDIASLLGYTLCLSPLATLHLRQPVHLILLLATTTRIPRNGRREDLEVVAAELTLL